MGEPLPRGAWSWMLTTRFLSMEKIEDIIHLYVSLKMTNKYVKVKLHVNEKSVIHSVKKRLFRGKACAAFGKVHKLSRLWEPKTKLIICGAFCS